MRMTENLESLINDSLAAVHADRDHDLNLGYREAIFWEFGPYRFGPRNEDILGHIRRVALAVMTVYHVLPIWEEAFPGDMLPRQALEEATRVIQQPHPQKKSSKVTKTIDKYWDHVEELMNETNRIEGSVGLASVRALSLSVYDDFATEEEVDFKILDSDEFTSNNTEFYAAAAYANGPVYPIRAASNSNPEKRQEFWEWWLRVAVPEAWNRV